MALLGSARKRHGGLRLYAHSVDPSRPQPSVGGTGKGRSPISPPPGLWTMRGVVPCRSGRKRLRLNGTWSTRKDQPCSFGAGPAEGDRIAVRERTEFSPPGGNGEEKRGGPKAAIPALGRGGTAERTRGPRRGTRGMRSLCRRCDDDSPPYWKYPPGSSTVASVSTGGLLRHAAGAGGAGAPPQQWDLWPNSKAFSPDKTMPPSIQGRHAPTPRMVHKPGGGEIGLRPFPVPPTDGRGREGC